MYGRVMRRHLNADQLDQCGELWQAEKIMPAAARSGCFRTAVTMTVRACGNRETRFWESSVNTDVTACIKLAASLCVLMIAVEKP